MKNKKRPCSICGRWFLPDARAGRRQTTCSSKACQTARRVRSQARWRAKNPAYQAEYRLRAQAAKVAAGEQEVTTPRGPPAEMGQVPWTFVKDEMGPQTLVILIYLVRLLRRSGKDEMRVEVAEIAKDIGRELGRVGKDQTDFSREMIEAPS